MIAYNTQLHAAGGSPSTVLITSCGEVAYCIIRTLRDGEIRSIVIHSDVDTDTPHVHMADMTTRTGPPSAYESYLIINRIIGAARRHDADGIHPGYGFLSENAGFTTVCEETGIEFINSSVSAINTTGDKISTHVAVEARNVPTMPGPSHPRLSDKNLTGAAPSIGSPVLIKPPTGGDGRGIHHMENVIDLPAALAAARREATGTFGDDSLLIEHFVDAPRHIEVQILADKYGNVIRLGEREYSLQRHHQKVIGEAPSPLLDEEMHSMIGEAVYDVAHSAGYVGAGMVGFIVLAKDPPSLFSVEMNTRLWVERPITKQVTGLDLVTLQVDIASGRPLPAAQKDVTLTGHSIETRVYTEDPAAGFLPTSGTVTRVTESSGAGIRVDSGITDGFEASSLYDPMLMRIVSHGESREQTFGRLDKVPGDTVVAGVEVNIDLCRYLLSAPEVHIGDLDTGSFDRIAEDFITSGIPDDVYLTTATDQLASRFEEATDLS